MLDFVLEEIRREPPPDYRRGLANIAVANSDPEALCGQITKILYDASPTERAYWFRVAADCAVISRMDIQDLNHLCTQEPFNGDELKFLIEGGRTDFFEQSKTRFDEGLDLLLEGAVFDDRMDARSPLAKIGEILRFPGYLGILDGPSTVAFSRARFRYIPFGTYGDQPEVQTDLSMIAEDTQLIEILQLYELWSKRPVSDWVHNLDIWNGLIERARDLWGDRWCLLSIASVASVIDIDPATLVGCDNLIDSATPLCSRAAYARSQHANHGWWLDQLDSAVSDSDIGFALLMLFSWADGRVLSATFDQVEKGLDSISHVGWSKIYQMIPQIMWVTNRRAEKDIIKISKNNLPKSMSPRLATCMLLTSNRV